VSRVDGHPEGCACARCPRPPDRAPDVEPGTLEHWAWVREGEAKQKAYEARFAERSEFRPKHWR